MRMLGFALALGCAAEALFAQNEALAMSTRSLGFHVSGLSGFELDGSARGVEGLDYSAGASVSTPAGMPVLHRLILDRSHNLYFGYDLIVSPAAVTGRVRLHFAPLSELSGFHADFSSFGRGKIMLPEDRTVSLREAATFALESDAANTPMLTDTLRFSLPR